MKKSNQQRRVLLIEPDYKNKYPPLGLMKLAYYHKQRGDYVRFFKGDLQKFKIDLYVEETIRRFYEIDSSVDWNNQKQHIYTYINLGRKAAFNQIIGLSKDFGPSLGIWLKFYWNNSRTGKIIDEILWDRICVTTLFTFYYQKTIDTINLCKNFVKKGGEILIGGIMATVIPEEIIESTGLNPIIGLLDKPGMLDKDDLVIIDELPPDYSILEEIDYNYPEKDAYLCYTTRGCIRKCDFCAVPKLEPYFNDFIPLTENIRTIDKEFGSRRNLLLLDNNVLASKKFSKIINEIKKAGFVVGSTYIEPNYLDIAVKNLRKRKNIFGYRRLAYNTLLTFRKKLIGQTLLQYNDILLNEGIIDNALPTQEQIINVYDHISELYETRRNKIPKKRRVDFNQGVDARLINEKKMALLSSIPISPLRIAFDNMKYAEIYENAIRLASKYNIRHLSNYLLFNYDDEPIELYQRLRLNISLSQELDLKIYSFPMRYSPIWHDEDYHHNRNFIGEKWNKKFIRAVQCVLNAAKGKIGRKKDFFEAAFGKNEDEYYEILWMPESYILYREKSEEFGYTKAWRTLFHSLSVKDFEQVRSIIESNHQKIVSNRKLKILLEHYKTTKEDICSCSSKMDQLIRDTYGFCKN